VRGEFTDPDEAADVAARFIAAYHRIAEEFV
jgi:hypothetical protein